MKRCAIFAEGGTEQSLLKEMLVEIAGQKQIRIETIKVKGKKNSRHGSRLEISAEDQEQKYFAAIYDCGSEDSVKTDLRDRYDDLCRAGYTSIIGIRDVLGRFTAADVPELRRFLDSGIKTKPVKVTMALVVMETEAWFLAEHTHFTKINPAIDLAAVTNALGFDPSQCPERVEEIGRPADSLDAIYRTAGERYEKTPASIMRTINALDIDRLYLELGARIPALVPLVQAINVFLA